MGKSTIDAELALTIVGAMTDTILIINSMGRIEFITSDDANGVLGRPADFWLGHSAFDFIHSDDLDGVRDRVKAALRNEAVRGDYLRLRLGTGVTPWLAAEAHGFTPITYQETPCVLVSVRDDTGQLANERARSAARNSLQVKPDPDGLLDNRTELMGQVLPRMFAVSANDDCFMILCVKAVNYQTYVASNGTEAAAAAMSNAGWHLVKTLRDDDLVARLSNDEILVACPKVETARIAQVLADRVLEAVNETEGIAELKMAVGFALGSRGDDFAMLVDHGRAIAGGYLDLECTSEQASEPAYSASPG